jgi:hypothetical protein
MNGMDVQRYHANLVVARCTQLHILTHDMWAAVEHGERGMAEWLL